MNAAGLMSSCARPGCGTLCPGSYCDEHQAEWEAEQRRRRGSAAQRGYGSQWRRIRERILGRDPICRACGRALSVLVDHKVPRWLWRHHDDPEAPPPDERAITHIARLLGRDLVDVERQIEEDDPDDDANLSGMCRACHDRKSQMEQVPR